MWISKRHGLIYEAIVLVAASVANGLAIKYLTENGASVAMILFWRGLGCLVLTLILARMYRVSILPRSVRTQLIRLALGGMTLLATTASYKYLSATTIAVLGRLDVPLLVIFGSIVGERASRNQMYVAILAVVVILALAFGFRAPDEMFTGYLLGLSEVGLFTLSLLLIRKSAKSENLLVVVMTPAFASVLYGSVGIVAFDGIAPTFAMVLSIAGTGIFMFIMYMFSARRFRVLGAGRAEYPSVLVVLAFLPLETIVLGHILDPWYVVAITLLCVLITFSIYMQGKKHVASETA